MAKKQHLLCFRNAEAIFRWNPRDCNRLWGVVVLIILTACSAAACTLLLKSRLRHTECSTLSGQPETPPPLQPFILGNSALSNTTPVFNVDPRLGRWDAQCLYKMIDRALVGSHFSQLSAEYPVCLATQSSVEKLHSLVQVAQHWTGPISAALFAAGDEEFGILQGYVDFLRRCYAAVRERISFHLAFPKEKVPTTLSYRDISSQLDCRNPDASLKRLLDLRPADILKWREENPYPQNHMRNLARKNCQSPQMFLTDVDIIPSMNLAGDLKTFFETKHCDGLCAYVIPTYELDDQKPFPKNKAELVRLAKEGLARPFHREVYIYGHYATNYSKWEQDERVDSVHVSHKVTNFEYGYEPFYVAHDLVPQHDERFIGYGYTRNSQVYEMFLAGYEFIVLSPVFTIHWGLQLTIRGSHRIKHSKGRRFRTWGRRQEQLYNRKKFDQFKLEVSARYPKDPSTWPPTIPKQQASND